MTESSVGVCAHTLTLIHIWEVDLCQAFNSMTKLWASQDHVSSYPEVGHIEKHIEGTIKAAGLLSQSPAPQAGLLAAMV